MLKQKMIDLGNEPSIIRSLFAYGLRRKAEVGEENVYDYSIGNPSVSAPAQVQETIERLIKSDPVALHGYSMSSGLLSTREAVAANIRDTWGIPAKADQVYITHGAAAALAICIEAITNPGDEVIVPTPFFPEYRTWIEQSGAKLVEVPCTPGTFDLSIEDIKAAITPRTAGIIVNSPNNPVGSVYSRENLEALSGVLREAEERLGSTIYLIADEPYRDITYGAEVPYIPCIYDRTLLCYSCSKGLSLPGERVGYIYINNLMSNVENTTFAIQGAGRALGYVCCSVLFQRVLEECIDIHCDVTSYKENRDLLCAELKRIGYEYVEPKGAFYLWVKSLEPDAEAFSDAAKGYDLLIVPSNSFGSEGYVRLSYCISKETIQRSIPAFEKLFDSYQ